MDRPAFMPYIELLAEGCKKSHRDADDRQYKMNCILSEYCINLSNGLKSVRRENECLQSRIFKLEKEMSDRRFESCERCVSCEPVSAFVSKNESVEAKVPVSDVYDSCEVLISNVSSLSHLQPLQIINRILSFASLASIAGQISSTRKWTVNSRTATNQKSTVSAFVVKFSSPLARDAFIRKTRKLKNSTASKVFGVQNGSKISVMNLLPKPTFLLLMKARKVYKSLDCAPPIVKCGVVYMRRSKQSPLSAIYSEVVLLKFKLAW